MINFTPFKGTKIYLYLFLVNFFFCYSQGEGNIWYFGQNAGLDFNSGSPVALINGQLNTTEGCSTISTNAGQLLFYTDGITVWNKNHQIMSNGTGLMGHSSSSQSAVIVPKPGSTNLYYIFTTPEKADPTGARYSIVDMSINGSLGDVTTVKNVLINSSVCEKIAVVKKDNLDEYWVVFHGFGSNSFFAYSISATGINNTPVVSNSGTVVTISTVSGQNDYAIGYLKFSPNAERLLCCNSYLNTELFDFDSTTGTVSNARVIYTGTQYYGAEFSPSSDLLYLSGGGFNNPKVFQYNLNVNDIAASEYIVFDSFNSDGFGALQLAPDNKIYIARNDRANLSVINNPDNFGNGCNFQFNGISLAPKTSKIGLPQFVQTIFNPYFTVVELCLNSNTQFNLNTTIVPNSVLWDFGDAQTSNSLNPTHQYSNAGNYNVSVTITTNNGSFTKNKLITIMQSPVISNPITNQTVCGSANTTCSLSQFNTVVLGSQSSAIFGVAYFSTLTDAVNHTNILPSNANLVQGINTFYAKVYNRSNLDCFALEDFAVELYMNPVANISNNIFFCDATSNTGIGTFNLQSNETLILGGQNPSQYNVTYHLTQNDADLNSNPLPLNYQNTSNPQTIYARVETNSQALNCYATTSFQIGFYRKPIANQVFDLFVCDDENNDGIEQFDLTQLDNSVLGSQSITNFKIAYHYSQAEANNAINVLNQNYTNVSNPQTIYVRIENRLSPICFDLTSFQLYVKPKPVLTLNDEYSICEGNTITISAPTGFTSYLWSNGETNNSTMISQAGNYSLTVTKDYGTILCDTTKNIIVNNSNIATITQIEIKDWTDNQNTIIIHVTGDGDYEYSLDGINYQDSNYFAGLNSGQYIVYVRDKKGCGIKTEEVFLLMYPKFFTPNGDGINETWQIKFSITEPDMEIILFDRYGKFITNFKGSTFGWDGTLNGKQLFADDYWFVVKRQNGKEYKGHFSLIR